MNVFNMFSMMLNLDSYVKVMMWWSTVTVYDMTCTLLSSHYVVCSLSVLSFHLYCICISTFVVNKRHRE